jgi:hypothetical protein
MKKLYLAVHTDGHITTASCPISETGAESKMIEVEDAEYEKAMSPEYKTSLFGEGIVNEAIPALPVKEDKVKSLEERITALETLNKK